MTVTVTAATHDDLDALVASVAGLFREDAGRHDPLMDLGWPAREGAAYYAELNRHAGPGRAACSSASSSPGPASAAPSRPA